MTGLWHWAEDEQSLIVAFQIIDQVIARIDARARAEKAAAKVRETMKLKTTETTMITEVDRTEKYQIQKITKPNGRLIRFQVVELPQGNSDKVKVYCTLKDARHAVGKSVSGQSLASPS